MATTEGMKRGGYYDEHSEYQRSVAESASATRAVTAVRERRATQPVAVLHNDLPTNDWNELFHNLAGSPDSYLRLDGPEVLPLVSAISFFESAAHWLREQPDVDVPEGFYFCEATGPIRSRTLTSSSGGPAARPRGTLRRPPRSCAGSRSPA